MSLRKAARIIRPGDAPRRMIKSKVKKKTEPGFGKVFKAEQKRRQK